MKRRNFLKYLGLGTGTAVFAPSLVVDAKDPIVSNPSVNAGLASMKTEGTTVAFDATHPETLYLHANSVGKTVFDDGPGSEARLLQEGINAIAKMEFK